MKRILCLLIALPFVLAPALALADEHKKDDDKKPGANLTMELKKKVEVEVNIKGNLQPNGAATAVVNNAQTIKGNGVFNQQLVNDASVSDNALKGAEGNIGVNTAAGTNNAQDNLTAIAKTEEDGALIDAEIYKTQTVESDMVENAATTNDATLNGSALEGAEGNIGVNLGAGTYNAQSNMTAISVGQGNSGIATVDLNQNIKDNCTQNTPEKSLEFEGKYKTSESHLAGTIALPGGKFESEIKQKEEHGEHEGPKPKSAKPEGHDDHGDKEMKFEQKGKFSFDDLAQVNLDGSNTTFNTHFRCATYPTTNTASFGGNALQGASGNIGVNIVAGSGNLQAN
ncbi:MAG: hypothetical protein D6694_08155, partial [Gammaproteobacteria bacterium]